MCANAGPAGVDAEGPKPLRDRQLKDGRASQVKTARRRRHKNGLGRGERGIYIPHWRRLRRSKILGRWCGTTEQWWG